MCACVSISSTASPLITIFDIFIAQANETRIGKMREWQQQKNRKENRVVNGKHIAEGPI